MAVICHLSVDTQGTNMSENLFNDLQSRVETLVRTCQELRKENHFLTEAKDELDMECLELREKHAAARAKVEGILEQLNSMELSEADEQ